MSETTGRPKAGGTSGPQGTAEPNAASGPSRAYWEDRYGQQEQFWSGRPNAQLLDLAGSLRPGAALDLGSGEGGDALWLAERGWTVTALDISQTALDRGAAEADRRGLDDAIVWLQRDLTEWQPVPGAYELVSACYLQSPLDFPRDEILRAAATAVAPGGNLLVVAHTGTPPWAARADADAETEPETEAHRAARGDGAHGHGHAAHGHGAHEHGAHDDLPSAAQTLDSLRLDPEAWTVLVCEDRRRTVTAPDGSSATLEDAVVLLERR
ncbi:class I SAM-dependent methyltransferase [Leucobacter sp. M11]|uniref:class I SAM-dependent methyltransferase n=1 Tax=Leucobacter sp. M11 TaxID=2993565 RepID=UPI002D81032F|nr:class I SAM-dependent methyltransferase [Leucobacter sp. M11]MEB4616083.1 class I SAM-dependent methyltransferase [Leucobacter sp. M11]